jgi:hypothetical protein
VGEGIQGQIGQFGGEEALIDQSKDFIMNVTINIVVQWVKVRWDKVFLRREDQGGGGIAVVGEDEEEEEDGMMMMMMMVGDVEEDAGGGE